MTVEKEDRPKSPVHVHVDDETPVHVHVKKPISKKNKNAQNTHQTSDGIIPKKSGSRQRNISPASAKDRWVPPPAKTSGGQSKVSWQAAGLKSNDAVVLDPGEVDTDEEDKTVRRMRQYEKRIDQLMNQVGSLKTKADTQAARGRQALRPRPISRSPPPPAEGEKPIEVTRQERSSSARLRNNTSPVRFSLSPNRYPSPEVLTRRALLETEEELADTRRELMNTDREREYLRRSMEYLKDEALQSRVESEHFASERDKLMRKLVQVEMDGQAAATQLSTLRDTVRRLREENILSKSDHDLLHQHREQLLERMAEFELTNRSLRQMLRDRHEQESNTSRLTEQRNTLLDKLTETEDRLQASQRDILDRDHRICDLEARLESQREENIGLSAMHSSLDSTRAHLQKQLRQKEGDCNRMAVQIRSLESQLAQERIDNDHLQTLLKQAKEKADQDKEALKKATRIQKTRATRNEDVVEQLNAQMMERDAVISELKEELNNYRVHLDKISKEKTQLESEKATLKGRMSELETVVMRMEDETKSRLDTSYSQLQERSSEASDLRLDNDQLRSSVKKLESQLKESDFELSQLRRSLHQHESLIEEYRAQMNRSRREADESIIQLEEQKRELRRVQKEGDVELEKVRSRLQARLQELEPIPELMRMTELKLQDATEQLVQLERTNTENSQLIADLTDKLEKQNDDLEMTKQSMLDEAGNRKQVESKAESLHRRIQEMEEHNRDLLSRLSRRDEAVHEANLKLDEKSRENSTLTKQLEEAVGELRRYAEASRDKHNAKERSMQSRVMEVENQLSETRVEITRIKREKEEMERKFNSKLYDLKDRLEQSHSTNRSLQNYVQFLKNSYANVFGDAGTLPSSSPTSFGRGGPTSLY